MRTRFLFLLLALTSSALVIVVVIGQKPSVLAKADQVHDLFVDDPRPLAKAAELLERRYGWRITYEDPSYVYSGDLVDKTASGYRGPLRALIPAGTQIRVSYPISANSRKPDNPGNVLQLLLDAHTVLGNPGVFRFIQNGDVFHIVPWRVRNTKGDLTNVFPILDIPITFSNQERSGLETLEVICAAVTERTGVSVIPGTVPTNLLGQHHTNQGTNNESARNALLRALDSTKRKLSWQLFYNAGGRSYYLNVHLIMQEVPTPAGGKVLREVR